MFSHVSPETLYMQHFQKTDVVENVLNLKQRKSSSDTSSTFELVQLDKLLLSFLS